MKDMSLLHYLLGITVVQDSDRDRITIYTPETVHPQDLVWKMLIPCQHLQMLT